MAMRVTLLFALLAMCWGCMPQERSADLDALRQQLESLAEAFDGDVGIYVRHLKTGAEVAINADSTFPSASIVKVPILVGVFDKIDSGAWPYDTVLTFHADSVNYPGDDDGIVASLKEGTPIALSKVLMLMITTSDNTGSLWLQQLVGGEKINALMDAHGFPGLRVNSRTPGREEFRNRYGWGQLTPRQISDLLVGIRNGKVVSAAASEEMYRVLTRIYVDGEALAQLPPWVQAASKQGAVNQSRLEVVLVNAPSGDYVFCVATKNQADASWGYDNEGYVLIRQVSDLLWRTFEPRSTWRPDYDRSRWW